jgi:hypothetical protein
LLKKFRPIATAGLPCAVLSFVWCRAALAYMIPALQQQAKKHPSRNIALCMIVELKIMGLYFIYDIL